MNTKREIAIVVTVSSSGLTVEQPCGLFLECVLPGSDVWVLSTVPHG